MCEALRPASVLAKSLATLDRICGGRLDVGIGAGWYEPDYALIGMDMPPPKERLARLREAIEVCRGLFGGGPFTFDGAYHRAVDALNQPTAVQRPDAADHRRRQGRPAPGVVAELADGWNTCWVWTPDAYRERLGRARARVRADRPRPATVDPVARPLRAVRRGRADLARRFERLRASSPPGVLDGVTLDQWRVGRLVGTVEQVREQAAGWAEPRRRDAGGRAPVRCRSR